MPRWVQPTSDMLGAIGLALMSSPRQAPLANMANTFPAVMQNSRLRDQYDQAIRFGRETMAQAPGIPGITDGMFGGGPMPGRGTANAAAMPGEITATGPGGQRLVLRNGQWQPLQ